MTTEELNEQTRGDWRELGFFYEHTENKSCWRFVGSRHGLLKFCDLLNEYADDEKYAALTEHKHHEPYWYLTFVTAKKPQITAYGIFGMPEDFRRLSKLTEQKLKNTVAGDKILIDEDYSQVNEAKIIFEVKEDDFDAEKADPLL